MKDQQRTETAADNCEVLRARLARYEDADGKPITTIAEQAMEIEKLEAGIPRLQEQLYQQRKELTALKPQPSGVVDAQRLLDWNRSQPEPRPIVVGREYQVADAYARLNQPASAGEPFKCDHAACVSLGEHHPFCEYVKQSIGGDDAERAAFEVCGVPVYQLQCREIGEGDWCPADLRHYTNCQKSPEMDTRIVEVRQARAALPVREAMAEGWKPAPVESTAEMEEAGCQAYMEADGTTCVMHNSSMRHAYKAMLAATPSAGSQEQG